MTAHPAKFSDSILEVLGRLIRPGELVLDPFAGTGKIHSIEAETWGVEIEHEWASMHPRTIVGDALTLPFQNDTFEVVATSSTYGNRLADSYNPKDGSKRFSYKFALGHSLHPNNSGQLQWGSKYREFHRAAWAEMDRVLQPNGRFILNISNHIRDKKEVDVAGWHKDTLKELGYGVSRSDKIQTPRLRFGANRARVSHENIFVFRKWR